MVRSVNISLDNELVTQNWYAIYTRFRSEKRVVDYLNRKEIECYLPLKQVVKRYTRKIRRYQVPLINSYVFVKINPKDQVKVLETEHVIKFIKPGIELYPIPDKEIETLRTIVGDGDQDLISTSIDFIKGKAVEVVSGSMAGIKGKIVEQANKNMFVVDLDHIGFSLKIQIDKNLLAAIK